jgi:hypothetical protein
MHAYELRIAEQTRSAARTVTLEAEDDSAAEDLVRHYYSELALELWREDRLVRRFEPVTNGS